jgi:outer membrane autotransporter protein
MGEQRLLTDEKQGGSWVRGFGRSLDREWSGLVKPKFDGSICGAQAGTDALALSGAHHRERVGIYGSFAQANGHVKGFALGQRHFKVGHLKLNSLGGGAYWTHADTRGWYVDNVVQGNYFFGRAHSHDQSAKLRGYGLAASIESGYPIKLPCHFEIEPQAQLIYNYEKLSQTKDRVSTVHFDGVSAMTSRAGIRVQHTTFNAWREYALVNVWNSTVGRAPLTFASVDTIALKTGSTALEMGLGTAGQIIQYLNFYAQVSYTISLDNKTQHGVFGNSGLRYNW